MIAQQQVWSRLTVHRLGALIIAAGLTGCLQDQKAKSPRSDAVERSASPTLTDEGLEQSLRQFQVRFGDVVDAAASEIVEGTNDVGLRRQALRWRIKTQTQLHEALQADDQRRALLDAWILCERIEQYFEEGGDGHQLFLAAQEIALEASQRCVAEIERIARMLLPQEQFESTREQVEAFVRQSPFSSIGLNMVRVPSEQAQRTQNVFRNVLNVPLAPFRPFEGIDRGAEAIQEFVLVARKFERTIDFLPQMVTWHLEMLMLDIVDNELTKTLISSTREISSTSAELTATAERMVDVAEGLPSEVRVQSEQLLQDLTAHQAQLNDTLQRLDSTAGSLDEAAQSTAQAGQAWAGTATAIQDMVAYFQTLGDKTATVPNPDKRPYDIKDYETTAAALTVAARELRALAADLSAVVESEALSTRLADVDARLQRNADHLAWRGAQLIVLAFILMVLYRLLSRRRTV